MRYSVAEIASCYLLVMHLFSCAGTAGACAMLLCALGVRVYRASESAATDSL